MLAGAHAVVELGGKRCTAILAVQHLGCDAVVLLGDKRLDFLLAVGDEPHSHALHPSGRQGRLDFAPQHRRQLEAHDAVEHAAGLLGVDQIAVDGARMLNGFQDGGLGDFVEHDAACVLGLEVQHFGQMPSDGFPLAVLITCQPHGLSLGGLGFQLLDQFLFVGRDFVDGFEAMLHIHTEIFLVKVADVSVTRHHFIILPQKSLNSLGLGRRLHNH